ncbi:MAG: EamA family transporter [Chloroflexi bacterium]|nr:EamA family transporter [Chloroflexota bacterium]
MGFVNFSVLLLLGIIWGSSFMFIKVGVAELPPLLVAAGRMGIGALFLLALLMVQGKRLPRGGGLWARIALMGLINNAIPFTLIPWGEERIPSALASILNATMPLFTVLIAHYWTADERLSRAKLLGVTVGFLGVMALMGTDVTDPTRASTQGELAVIVAAACYAVATIFARKYLHGPEPAVLATGQLATGFVFTLPPILLTVRPGPAAPSFPALASVAALGLLGSGLAYLIYYWLLRRINATQMSLVTYLLPVTAVFWGAALLGESLGANHFLGLGLIFVGIMVVNGTGQLAYRRLGHMLSAWLWPGRA